MKKRFYFRFSTRRLTQWLFIYFLHPKSVSLGLIGRYSCVFWFLSLWWASLFVIALNNGWLAAWFEARRCSVIIMLHAGSADGRRTPHLQNLCHLACPQPTVLCSVIMATAPRWLSQAVSPKVGPPSCWLRSRCWAERTARGIALPGYVAHVECFEVGVCVWGSVPDYTPSGLLCREKLFCLACRHGLTCEGDTAFSSGTYQKKVKGDGRDVWRVQKRGQFRKLQKKCSMWTMANCRLKNSLSKFKHWVVSSVGPCSWQFEGWNYSSCR